MIPWWLIPSGELLERYLPAVYVDEAALGILPARVSLLNRDPHPDDAAVPRLWWVRVQAVHPSADLDPASARLWVDGVLVYDGATFAAGWDREGRSWARTGSEMDHPAALQLVEVCALNEVPLASEATVTVRFAVDVDGGGDPVDESWSFAVEDWTPPEIVGVRAVDERTIDVTWDDAMRMAGDGDPADALTASAYV